MSEIRTRPVGERFDCDGMVLEVVEYDSNKEGCGCWDCAFYGNCFYNEIAGSCRWHKRSDGTDVIFKKIAEKDENIL